LKVLQVIPDLRKGGAERILIDICNELVKRGVEVLLLNFRPENHYSYLTEKIERWVIPARFVPSIFGKPLAELEAYSIAVQKFKPDVIHSHLFEAEMVTRQVIHPGIKYVSHLHSNMEQFRKFSLRTLMDKSLLTNFLERKLLLAQYRRCSNNFIVISKHAEDFYKQVLPADLRRLQILNNAIDYNRFFKREPNQLHIPLRLITIGRLDENKNQIFLVKVVRLLKSEGIQVQLDILGEGPFRKHIEGTISDWDLKEQVNLLGSVNQIEEQLHKADIYIHAARSEAFGLAIVEAMAAGLPFVMLDAKGNRDIAENGKNGFFITEENVNAFANAIKNFISAPKRYSEMSDYAKTDAAKFDIVPYADRLLQFYNSCAKS